MKFRNWLYVIGFLFITPSLFAQTRTKPLNPAIDSLFPDRPTNYLTDLAGIVRNSDEVNSRLKIIRDSNNLSLVAVTLASTHGRAPERVATEIGRKWLVATANDSISSVIRNTGGVILISMDPRRCQIAVATGSEGYMTDYRAAQACRNAVSDFRAGNFGDGIISIANEFVKYHNQELARSVHSPRVPSEPFNWGFFGSCIVFIILIIIPIGYYLHEKNEEKKRAEAEEFARWQAIQREEDRKAAIRRAEYEEKQRRDAKLAAEKEAARWAALTPEEQAEELRQREEARRAAEAAAAAAALAAEEEHRRRRQREEEEERQRSYYSSNNDYSSPSSPSYNDSSWSSGGSDSFSGGGGGSSF